jgi:phenylalanyl-tRNA synthetase beta chain
VKVPLRWLKDYIDLPTEEVSELSYAFDMLGLTVDGVEFHSADWTNVHVGRVDEIAPHPNADKIRVCVVDAGEGPVQIICGAWNFGEGAYVAVARPGAVLPGGFEIDVRDIRGVVSNGMICSEKELGLGRDHDGILVLDGQPPVGVPFAETIELPDVVFDLDVTPNRPDALSIQGIARDLAAHYGIEYSVPEMVLEPVPGATTIEVTLDDEIGCRRFTAREITGVKVGKAPFDVRHRLHKVGVRSISNVVDVTNYVMFELGHPLHAFDADRIVGGRLSVRRATAGETLVTLDDQERQLDPEDLIIYDAEGPTSMSGTMGGARSEVSEGTTRILMEAASWDPPTIMQMWRRHELRSEAATRFERGVDPNLSDVANQRASAMVAGLTGGQVLEGFVDEVAITIQPAEMKLHIGEVERILGPGFSSEMITDILRRLGLSVSGTDPIDVIAPTFRPDITRPADLIEEIARIHGFDKFEATLPTGPSGGLTVEQRRQRLLHTTLVGCGLIQSINLPFVSVEDLNRLGWTTNGTGLLTVKNPLREEESKLRPTLLPGLLNNLRFNRSHGAQSVSLFETGKVFFSDPSPVDGRLPDQYDKVAWAVIGEMGIDDLAGSQIAADAALSLGIWRRVADALDLDAELRTDQRHGYHPGRTAGVYVDDQLVGYVGELSPRVARTYELAGRVAIAEIDLSPLLTPVEHRLARIPSVYPHVDFDLSFVVDVDLPVASVVATTIGAAGDLVESGRVFDEFRDSSLGESKKAIAIRYRLRAPDRTLEAGEIGAVRATMIAAASGVGAEIRGAQ